METVEKRVNPFSAKRKPPWNPRGKEGGFPHVFHGSPRFGRLGRAFFRSFWRPEKLFFQKFSLSGVFSCLFGGNNRQKPCLLLRIPVGFPRFHRLWKSGYGKPFSFCGKGFGNRFHIFSEPFSTGILEKKQREAVLFGRVFPPGKAVFLHLMPVLCPLLIFQISSPASAWRPWLRFRRRLRFGGRRCRSWGASG